MSMCPHKKILIADDTATIVAITECALQNAGYEVLTASSGPQAVEAAMTHGADLALLDYRMPGMNGLQAGKAIYALTGTRFVMMSAHSDNDIINQAAADGALGFIVKPLDAKELVAQINVALTRAAEIRQLKNSLQNLEETYNAAIAKAVESSRSVNTAIGILMERQQCPREHVYQSLVSEARNKRRRLVTLSEEIIKTREADYGKSIHK